jgi:hypothetical protein
MDLTTIERALADLYAHAGHLPRPDDLAQTVLDAYNDNTLGSNSPWRLAGVVAALWPVGAAAGAARGHTVTVAALRDLVAQALDNPSLDARSHWVIMGMVRAADQLPAGPKPTRAFNVAHAGVMAGDSATLVQALKIGLANSWVVGHRDASERAVVRFAVDVTDLVGQERLTTTFLTPMMPAYAALLEFELAATRVAERDREDPPPEPSHASPGGRPNACRHAPRRPGPTAPLHISHPSLDRPWPGRPWPVTRATPRLAERPAAPEIDI